MPSGLRPLHPIHTPTAASARHRAPPTLCALCTYGARRALCTSVASPPRWQRHRRLGRGHLRRAVLRRAVGGSRGPERGSTSHTDAALEATVAAWRAGAAAAAAAAAAAEAEGAAAAAAAAEAAAAAAGAAHAAAHQARLPAQGCSPSGGALSLRGGALPPGAREARTLAAWLPKCEACSVAWCALVAAQRRPFALRPSRCGQVHGGSGQRPAEQRSATACLLL